MDAQFLESLNVPQLKAVQHPPSTPLQILAGPGSGKTKVLTTRIAYLILHHGLPPQSICAVTFTNKAAKEMRERLERLIGKERTGMVRMGTFHALCAGFLRVWSGRVGLGVESNFTVCDAEESKKIISKLLEPHKHDLEARNISLKEGTVLSLISKAKAKGQDADDLLFLASEASSSSNSHAKPPPTIANDIQRTVAHIYRKYTATLRCANALDFDDLLLFGVKLFGEFPQSVGWCQHVLVDEFQDTNTTQYELMKHIAASHGCVTVVGDPDQSIYGWRSAEIENLSKMRKDFTTTQQIFLEQNYRSTGSILSASVAIVAQDKTRIPKTLHTSHPSGPTPVLRTFPDEASEASFIAVEVKRLVAAGGGLLGWNDFVVLLRFNALSRAVESALQKEGIASRVLGGHKFFERAEIKDLLAYLQIIDNPHFIPAFSRAINTPHRGIGDKTIAEILARATKLNSSPLSVVERIYDGKIPDIKPPVKKKLKGFVEPVKALRKLSEEETSPADLIRRLLDLIKYEDYLKHKDAEWTTRWENVQELITFASEAPTNDEVQVDVEQSEIKEKETPLRSFLQASMLSSEGDNDDGTKEKVTISTCHAAKGLEWPVVMVPAVEQGTFPFYRTDDVEEERRLLYVACTRAQGLLYLSHAANRRVGGETKKKDVSEFVSAATKDDQSLFTSRLPDLSVDDRIVLASVLDRPVPNESEVQKRVQDFNRTNRSHHLDDDGVAVSTTQWPSKPWNGSAEFYTPAFQTLSSFVPKAPVHPYTSVSLAQSLAPTRTVFTNSASAFSSQCAVPTNTAYSKAASGISHTVVQATVPSYPPIRGQHAVDAASSLAPSLSSHGADQISISSSTVVGGKRRLGMGRGGMGYSNKKFKTPGS